MLICILTHSIHSLFHTRKTLDKSKNFKIIWKIIYTVSQHAQNINMPQKLLLEYLKSTIFIQNGFLAQKFVRYIFILEKNYLTKLENFFQNENCFFNVQNWNKIGS